MFDEPWSASALLGLGLVFGLKHALDADHLAAVATLATEKRTVFQSGIVGAVWGFGHTVALLAVGAVVLALRLEISPTLASLLEACVAVMLVYLGGRALWQLAGGGRIHIHPHRHGERWHVHPHIHSETAAARHQASEHDQHRRPFAIGLVHGLAGSAALMLLIAASTPSPWLGLAYIASFGVGSIGGMIAMSALVSVPALWSAERFTRLNSIVRGGAGVFSIGVGLFVGYEVWFGFEAF